MISVPLTGNAFLVKAVDATADFLQKIRVAELESVTRISLKDN